MYDLQHLFSQAKTLWARGESDPAIRLASALGPSLKELESKALDHPEPGGRALEVQARRLAGA